MPMTLLAVAIAEALLHHAAQRGVEVAVVEQVVGDLLEHRLGVEVEPHLRAVPAGVPEARSASHRRSPYRQREAMPPGRRLPVARLRAGGDLERCGVPLVLRGHARGSSEPSPQTGLEVDVVYRSFELDPNVPARRGSPPLVEYLARKFGDPSRVQAAHARLTDAGRRARHRLPVVADAPRQHVRRPPPAAWALHTGGPRPSGRSRRRSSTPTSRRAARSPTTRCWPTSPREAGWIGRWRPRRCWRPMTSTEFVRAEREEAYGNGINAVPTFVVEGQWMLQGALDTDEVGEGPHPHAGRARLDPPETLCARRHRHAVLSAQQAAGWPHERLAGRVHLGDGGVVDAGRGRRAGERLVPVGAGGQGPAVGRSATGSPPGHAEDFALYAEHGLTHHRLSLEWARLEPRQGHHDLDEVERYRQLLQSARDAGVSIWACLHHFTLPGWFADDLNGLPRRPPGPARVEPPRRLGRRDLRRPRVRVEADQRTGLVRARLPPPRRAAARPPRPQRGRQRARARSTRRARTPPACCARRRRRWPRSRACPRSSASRTRPESIAAARALRGAQLGVMGRTRAARRLRPASASRTTRPPASPPTVRSPPGRSAAARAPWATCPGPRGSGHVLHRLAEAHPGRPLLVCEAGIGTDDEAERTAYVEDVLGIVAGRHHRRDRRPRPVLVDRRRQLRVAPRLRRALRPLRPRPQPQARRREGQGSRPALTIVSWRGAGGGGVRSGAGGGARSGCPRRVRRRRARGCRRGGRRCPARWRGPARRRRRRRRRAPSTRAKRSKIRSRSAAGTPGPSSLTVSTARRSRSASAKRTTVAGVADRVVRQVGQQPGEVVPIAPDLGPADLGQVDGLALVGAQPAGDPQHEVVQVDELVRHRSRGTLVTSLPAAAGRR